jgi:hypothetical protein
MKKRYFSSIKKVSLLFCLLFLTVYNLSAQAAFTMTALEYYNDWSANELRAEQRYKGEKVQLTGQVIKVGRLFGSLHVEMRTTGRFLSSIDCYFLENQLNVLANYNPGDTITILGTAEGKMHIKNCTVVPPQNTGR